jgi:phosphate starvation-inducible membrane PsiE
VVICTDCIGSYKSNYYTIMTTTTLSTLDLMTSRQCVSYDSLEEFMMSEILFFFLFFCIICMVVLLWLFEYWLSTFFPSFITIIMCIYLCTHSDTHTLTYSYAYLCLGCNHNPVFPSFMTYHQLCNTSNTTGTGTINPSGVPDYTPGFSGDLVAYS